jgi:hypothetical protein
MNLQAEARRIALKEGIPPDLFMSLIRQESNWNQGARSSAGAMGMTQLMPGTAAELGVRDPWNPIQNMEGGARYLARQLKAFGGDERKALQAYNAGPGAVQRYGGNVPYRETQEYVEKILKGRSAFASTAANNIRPRMAGTPPGAGQAPTPAVDPFVATAVAGARPQASADPLAKLQTTLKELAGFAGTSDFGGALRRVMPFLREPQAQGMDALDEYNERMAAAIFGRPRRTTPTAGSNDAMTPFRPARTGVSPSGAVVTEPLGSQTPNVGGGSIKVGQIAGPGQDIYPTTGPHLDVRVMKDGEYINPAFTRSLLQNLRVGGQPLYSQRDDGQWAPAFPVTSPYGPRSAPTAGASTYHRGVDYGVPAGTKLEWTGGGTYSRQQGYGQIELPSGEIIKLLHTIG